MPCTFVIIWILVNLCFFFFNVINAYRAKMWVKGRCSTWTSRDFLFLIMREPNESLFFLSGVMHNIHGREQYNRQTIVPTFDLISLISSKLTDTNMGCNIRMPTWYSNCVFFFNFQRKCQKSEKIIKNYFIIATIKNTNQTPKVSNP